MRKKVDCPVYQFLDFLGKKWIMLIINAIYGGKKQFSHIKEAVPGISGNLLSQRLSEMVEQGIIDKSIISTDPLKIEYSLTKKGSLTAEPLHELIQRNCKQS